MAIGRVEGGVVLFSIEKDDRGYEAEWFPRMELAKESMEIAEANSPGAYEFVVQRIGWDYKKGQMGRAAEHRGRVGDLLGVHDEDWNMLELWALSEKDDVDKIWNEMEAKHPNATVRWFAIPE